MSNKIQVRRGAKANLPTLSVGEPAFTTNTEQFYIGNGTSNIEFAKQSDLDLANTSLSEKANDNVTLSKKNLPSTFNNNLDNLTETGIYCVIWGAEIIQNEPIQGATGGRRVTIEVVNASSGLAFQSFIYNDYAGYTGQKFERMIGGEWTNSLTNASLRNKSVVVAGNGTTKMQVILDGIRLTNDAFAINSNPSANETFVIGTRRINSNMDVEVTLNQIITTPIQLTLLYWV